MKRSNKIILSYTSLLLFYYFSSYFDRGSYFILQCENNNSTKYTPFKIIASVMVLNKRDVSRKCSTFQKRLTRLKVNGQDVNYVHLYNYFNLSVFTFQCYCRERSAITHLIKRDIPCTVLMKENSLLTKAIKLLFSF